MSGFNQAIVMGNLGRDPELRFTQTGTPVCRMSVATTRVWTDKENQKHEETEWHRIVVWGKQAQNCGEYLSKGRQVHVCGRLRTSKWQAEDGTDRYTTEIVADTVQFVGSAPRDGRSQSGGQNNQSSSGGGGGSQGFGGSPRGPEDDDIPF
jgi:single-strand DNA-binding protein